MDFWDVSHCHKCVHRIHIYITFASLNRHPNHNSYCCFHNSFPSTNGLLFNKQTCTKCKGTAFLQENWDESIPVHAKSGKSFLGGVKASLTWCWLAFISCSFAVSTCVAALSILASMLSVKIQMVQMKHDIQYSCKKDDKLCNYTASEEDYISNKIAVHWTMWDSRSVALQLSVLTSGAICREFAYSLCGRKWFPLVCWLPPIYWRLEYTRGWHWTG